MPAPATEIEQLSKAVQWLRSHQKRLDLDRRSLAGQVEALSAELERVGREIQQAEQRLHELTGR